MLGMAVSAVSFSVEVDAMRKRRLMNDNMRMSSRRMDIHILCRLYEADSDKLRTNDRLL